MNKDRIIRYLIASVLSLIAAINITRYVYYKYQMRHDGPVSYRIVDTEVTTVGSRGLRSGEPRYWLIVKFDRTIAQVRVSKYIFHKAGRGDLPELYFTDTFHQVYGAWDVRAAFEWFLFSGLGAILCWMPVGKWWREREERRKAKQKQLARYKRASR